MKRALRILLMAVVVVLAAAAALGAYVYVATERLMARTYTIPSPPRSTVRTDAASVARGRYLAEHVALCVECHGDDLGGATIYDNVAMGRITSPNLTTGQGGATYSDDDFARAILHGVKRDGRSVILMPSIEYQFTEADFGALVAYVRSKPPVNRVQPTPSVGPVARALAVFAPFPLAPASVIDHAKVRFSSAPDASDPAATGAYLAAGGGCAGCHREKFQGGGGPAPGAGNITPVGIGDWNEQQFITAIREHRRPNGTIIDDAMPRTYGQMTDADLRAIFAFLRTVPAAGEKTPNQKKGPVAARPAAN